MPARVQFIVNRAVSMPEVKSRKFKKYAPESPSDRARVTRHRKSMYNKSLSLFVVRWIGAAMPFGGRDYRGICGSQAT